MSMFHARDLHAKSNSLPFSYSGEPTNQFHFMRKGDGSCFGPTRGVQHARRLRILMATANRPKTV